MRNTLGIVSVAVLVLIVILGLAHAKGPADVPAGVNAAFWRPLTEDVGLVLRPGGHGKFGGYLMAKVDGQWHIVTLYDSTETGVLPAR